MPSTRPSRNRFNNRAQRNGEAALLGPSDASLSDKNRVATLRAVRERVETLRVALLDPSPEDLDRCLPSLLDAIGAMVSIEQELQGNEPTAVLQGIRRDSTAALRTELNGLKRELRVVTQLIENGAAFWQHWARFLGAAQAGYISTGEPAPLTAGGSVSFRG